MINNGKEIEVLLERLPSKGRLRFFLFFVFISFFFWISTKLSNTYTLEQSFSINWNDVPEGIIISDKEYKLNTSIKASGIEVMFYRLFLNELNVSLKEAKFSSAKGIVNTDRQRFFVEQQLFNNTILNQISPVSLEFEYSNLEKKNVPIIPKIEFNLRPGYLLDKPLSSIPDSILISGPKTLLDSIHNIETQFFSYDDIFEPFSYIVKLKKISKIQMPIDEVKINLSVSRYSEKEFILPIEILNLPKDKRVKLFPPKVKVKVTLPVSIISTVKDSDFSLVVDYNEIVYDKARELELSINKQPPAIKQIILEPKKVNFLIRR